VLTLPGETPRLSQRALSASLQRVRQEGFADPRLTDAEGVVAVGGPLDGRRLLAAYEQGIFPWSGDPVRWHSPDPRAIFWKVRLPSRLGRLLRRGGFSLSFDCAFEQVVLACAEHHRAAGEWITPAFVGGYTELHRMGHAHSVEVWRGQQLVGGLYGVQVAGLFSGESMFFRASNASKVAFAALTVHLFRIGIALFDSQVLNRHTLSLGAALIDRSDFLQLVDYARSLPTRYDGERWPPHAGGTLHGTPLESALRVPAPAPATPVVPPRRFWAAPL
jgi:leucyl/phenylalanyl-tRNA--protein transferase